MSGFDPRRYTENMDRQTTLQLLATHKPLLVSRYGVAELAFFGSTARDAARQGSDIDILFSFDGPASSAQYFGVLFYLEDVLGCAVDLVTQKALRKEIRPLRGARGRACLKGRRSANGGFISAT